MTIAEDRARRPGAARVVRVTLVLLAVLASVAAAASASASTSAPPGPPKPKVTTLGVTRFAKVFTSCWKYAKTPVCADGSVGYPGSTLHWRPGAKVTVDLRLPARDVSISAEHVYAGEIVASDSVRLRLHRAGASGQRWTLRLPALAARCTDLIVYARLGTRGDLAADLGLRPR